MPGLENLALIPGGGSSPIQNIGAYGVELQRVCDHVDALSWKPGEASAFSRGMPFWLSRQYLKHEYQDRFAIVAIGLSLQNMAPVLSYGDLTRLDPQPYAAAVFDAVCHMRILNCRIQRLTVMPAVF